MLVGGTTKPLNNKAFPPCCNARTVRSVDEGRKVFGMAGRKGWTITGVDERVRAEAVAAAARAGMRFHEWIEQAVREALRPEPEPAPPEGVEIDELEAMVRRVVAEELGPVRGVRGGLGALAAPGPPGREPATFRRERMRRRRSP